MKWKRLKILFIKNSEEIVLNSDKEQLGRVFLNLIKNSIESIHQKIEKDTNTTKKIAIELSDHDDHITLTIIDSGIGFGNLKENINTLTNCYDIVNDLNPVGFKWNFHSVGQYLDRVDEGSAVNVAYLIPHGTVRILIKGNEEGYADSNELAQMSELVESGVKTDVAEATVTKFEALDNPTDGSFQSAKGNEGLASYVRDNNGSITYAELSYLEERGVKAAAVSNPAGKYVLPSPTSSAVWLDAAEVAADGLVTQNFAATAADAYPINAVSYGLSSTAVSATNTSVKAFFKYFLDTCAPKNAAGAGYTPLTGAILAKADAQAAKINVG